MTRAVTDRDRWLALGLLAAGAGAGLPVAAASLVDGADAGGARSHRRRCSSANCASACCCARRPKWHCGCGRCVTPKRGVPASSPKRTHGARHREPRAAARSCRPAGQPRQPQLRDHQPLAADRRRRRARSASARSRCRCACVAARRNWRPCCTRWRPVRRGCSSTTSTCWRSGISSRRDRRARRLVAWT